MPKLRLQDAHIGINGLVRRFDGDVIVLIGVAHVEKDRFIEVFDIDPGLQLLAGIAVRAVSRSDQADIVPGHQLFDDVPAAVIEVAGVVAVAGIIIRQGVGADKQVDGGKGGISRNIIEDKLRPPPSLMRGLA